MQTVIRLAVRIAVHLIRLQCCLQYSLNCYRCHSEHLDSQLRVTAKMNRACSPPFCRAPSLRLFSDARVGERSSQLSRSLGAARLAASSYASNELPPTC